MLYTIICITPHNCVHTESKSSHSVQGHASGRPLRTWGLSFKQGYIGPVLPVLLSTIRSALGMPGYLKHGYSVCGGLWGVLL